MTVDNDNWLESLDSGLERSLDKFEAENAPVEKEVQEPAAVETPAVETEEAEVTPEVEAPKEAKLTRDKSGKFQKAAPKGAAPQKQISGQEANAQGEAEPQGGETPQAQTPIELPAFWSADEKAAVAKAPPEALEVIARKEAQRNDWANRLAAESASGKAFQERMYADMTPEAVSQHKAALTLHGIRDEIEELHRYRAWDTVFKTDVRAGILKLMQDNKLSPQDLFVEDENPYQSQPQFDPEEIQRKAEDAAEAKLKAWEKAQNEKAINSDVEAFKQGKDSHGEVRAKFWEVYEPHIGNAIVEVRRQFPNLSRAEVLNRAYEATKSAIYDLHGIKPGPKAPPQKTPAELSADAAKAKAASGSIRGGPASGVTPKARPKGGDWLKTLDEAADRALDQHSL